MDLNKKAEKYKLFRFLYFYISTTSNIVTKHFPPTSPIGSRQNILGSDLLVTQFMYKNDTKLFLFFSNNKFTVNVESYFFRRNWNSSVSFHTGNFSLN